MAGQSNSEKVAKALQGVSSVVRGLLCGASRDEVLARHRVGSILCELKKSPAKYGEHAVDSIASEVGFGAPTLYRYAAVAEHWTSEDIKADLGKTNRFGQPLTWTHFVALSRVAQAAPRRALLEKALENAWSARALNAEIDAAERKDIDRRDEERPVRAALKEGIQSATRASSEVEIFVDGFLRRLSDLDGKADAELVAQAIEVFHRLSQRAEETLSHLQAARDSEMHLRVASTVSDLGTEEEQGDGEEHETEPVSKQRQERPGKP